MRTALARTLTHVFDDENGLSRARACIDSITGGIEAIVFHDKLKGCYKDLVRKLGQELQVSIYRHQKLRTPEELTWGISSSRLAG